jgi:tetratricopeptide (TPR) repeat protein
MRKTGGILLLAFLISSALGAQDSRLPVRDLKVLVIADEEYQRDPRWVSRSTQMIRSASADFEDQFGIRLVPSPFESWHSDDNLARIDVLAASLASGFDRYGADLLVVLSGQESLGRQQMGYSLFKEGLIILAPPPGYPDMLRLFEHHLGHFFGAVHAPSPPSDPGKGPRGEQFSDANKEIILLNKDRTFNKPDSPALPVATERAIELYRSICDSIQKRLAEVEKSPLPPPPSGHAPVGYTVEVRSLPNFADVYLLLSQIYLSARQYDQALASCMAAVKLDPDSLEAQNTLGIIYRRTGDFEKAIAQYLEVFRKDPHFARTIFNLGVAFFQQGDLDAALGAYQAALSINPAYAEAQNNMGEIFIRQGRLDLAEDSFRKAVASSPAFALSRSNLAEVLVRKGDFAGAEPEADEAVRLDPGLVAAIVIQGNVDRGLGRVEEAVRHYLKALSLDPKNVIAMVNLGICAFGRGDFAGSEKLFREALALNPAMAEARAGLGACLLKRKELDAAHEALSAALTLGLNSAEVHLNLSSIALERKKYDEAIAEANLALGLNAQLADAYRNLGAAYVQKGMKRESQEALAAAARLARGEIKRAM